MIISKAKYPPEFESSHRLNYKVFVEEIPQHPANDQKKLVDPRHERNQYIIAKKHDRVIGMVCYNMTRPFSLDQKLPDLDRYLPSYNKIAEIRLLAIEKQYRNPLIAYRLLQNVCNALIKENVDIGVISGTVHQLKLYDSLGFVPFGPLVGKPDALYQPMYITIEKLRHDFRH